MLFSGGILMKVYMKKFACSLLALTLAAMVSPLWAQARKTAVSLYNQAYAMQQREDYYGAIETYQEALQMNAQYGDAWYNLAVCTFCLGEYDLSVKYADTAAKYSRNLTQVQNLKGLALIALGRINEARTVFNGVLAKYPNDIDARFGLAEIDLYGGSLSAAEKRYLDALKRDANNRKALLSLALVTSEEGKDAVAERYVNQALEYHSSEAEVHYLAAYLAAKRGNLQEAERRARSAVQIRGNYDKAYELLSQILYSQGRYNEVIDFCEFRIGRNRKLSTAWYLKGLSQAKLGNSQLALSTFTTGLSIDPYDEVMRFALEHLISDSLDIEDSRRGNWAKFHVSKAAEFKRNFDGPSERYEYQKALSVDPLNSNARQKFANMLERDGFYELYLNQLKFIGDNYSSAVKKSDQQVKNEDTQEALESLMISNLANKWNVNPFYLDKTRWNLGIYYKKAPVQLLHADAEQVISRAAKDLFNGIPSTSVNVQAKAVDGFGEAFRLARTGGRDYFAILEIKETDRSFSLDATLYSARTGTKTTEIHVYRTGNDRVSKSLRRFRQAVLDILPIRGKVLRNTSGTLLVDLGKSDGMVQGAQFDVVKQGKILTADSGTGVYYDTKDMLGTFVIDKVNEEISEGAYTKKGFYDTLNAGDEVILVKLPDDQSDAQGKDGNAVTDTRPAADNNGKPATDAAEAAERQSIREDLKAPVKESPLIKMIQNIM